MPIEYSADAMQANLGFVVEQTTHVEASVYKTKYPEVQYQDLIPVDNSAHPFATSVTYYSSDYKGAARWIAGRASDVPNVSGAMEQHQTGVYMAGIGYDYGYEEVGQAAMLGLPLQNDKADTARRISEEFIDKIALEGDTLKSFEGLYNYTGVPVVALPADGAGSSALWSAKTPELILRDVNDLLTGVWTATRSVAMANTLLLPYTRFAKLASTQLTGTTMTLLQFIRENNVYTATTGQELIIRGIRGLDTAGAGGVARMVAYRRAPDVLKLHLPMPFRFLPVQINGLSYEVPGIFRLGGLDIRLPQEVRYGDGS